MKQPIKATDNRNMKKFDIKEWQTKHLNEASVDTSMTKKELVKQVNSLMAGSLGIDDKGLLKKIVTILVKASQKNIHKFDATEDGSMTKRWLKEAKTKNINK